MKYFIISLFFFLSSACLAVQTRQQCKDSLFNPALRQQICDNHADYFSRYLSPAVGIIIKNKHYLYKDETEEDYSPSGLEQLAKNMKVSLGSNAEILQDINAFHKSLVSASGENWFTLSSLLNHRRYDVPKMKPLKLLLTISFADVAVPEPTFKFDGNPGGLLKTVELLDQATATTDCSESPKVAPPVILQTRLSDRTLGASLTAMKYGVGAEAYTEEIECPYKDGQTRKVVLVCPWMPEQQERKEKCSPSKKQLAPSLWTKMLFGSHSYTQF